MTDTTILQHINALVQEEHDLRADQAASDGQRQRIRDIEVQLDQCWDLLRQRRARREFGDDPNGAAVRDVNTVEGYLS